MNLEKAMYFLSIKLYSNLHLARSDVQSIMEIIQEFLITYNMLIKTDIYSALQNCVEENVLRRISEIISDAPKYFYKFSSSEKRLLYYKKSGIYIEPVQQRVEAEEEDIGVKLLLQFKPINIVYIPLQKSITQLLETPGLFDSIVSYIFHLYAEKKILENFIQGSVWRNIHWNFPKDDGLLLPLALYCDDFEPFNALGSHAEENEICAVYVSTPCLPPTFSSKLQSIILAALINSEDRKTHRNV